MPVFNSSMNNQISPEISVNNDKMPNFPVQAIYIEAFNEYFSEVANEAERVSLLQQLNEMLSKNLNIICCLYLPEETEKNCLALIKKDLGENSALEKQLSMQITSGFWRPEFLNVCQANNIDTVHIGGVYGRACVWDCARAMAENIYAKQFGDGHPNIRCSDTNENYRFKNAVILPTITEGYFPEENEYAMTDVEQNSDDSDLDMQDEELVLFMTLDEFVCFPETRCFNIDLAEDKTDIFSEGKVAFPDQLGESFGQFSTLDADSIKCYELFVWIENLPTISPVDVLANNPHSFWADNVTEKEAAPSALENSDHLLP